MTRITQKRSDGLAFVAPEGSVRRDGEGWAGPAIDRLAVFENLQADLAANQEKYAQEMDALRAAGKEKTARFRELMVFKMTGRSMLDMFTLYKL